MNNEIKRRQQAVSEANQQLGSVLMHKHALGVETSGDALADALKILAADQGFKFVHDVKEPQGNPIRQIARASGIQVRKITLESNWWKYESAPCIGFLLKENINDAELSDDEIIRQGTPIAILCRSNGTMYYVEPKTGEEFVINSNNTRLSRLAYHFFHTFDDTKPVKIGDVFRLGVVRRNYDIAILFIAGLVVGLIGMIPPIMQNWIIDKVIPLAESSLLIQLTAVLIALSFSQLFLGLLRTFAEMRIRGAATFHLEGAVWDRLVRLPVNFFRQYSTGDLVARADGINAIRDVLTSSMLNTILSAVFCVPSMVLMFYYSTNLALLGLLLVAVCCIMQIIGVYLSYHFQTQLIGNEAAMSNLTYQYFAGIEKLRSAFAEDFVYAKWAKQYAEVVRIGYHANVIMLVFGLVSQLVGPLSLLCIYWYGIHLGSVGEHAVQFSAGTFVGFLGAFGNVQGAVLGVVGSLSTLIQIVPIWKRMKPILDALPERTVASGETPVLTGRIDIRNVVFGYNKDGKPVLDNISFTVEPGEFIAVVGESGAGKSTLLRLLLGFETPSSGGIFYDQQDIQNLDVRLLRQQFGVVLQGAGVMDADIFNNIAGGTGCTVDDAWEAAKLAGIADDIKAMPMQMMTFISQNGGTISGGQRQRIMIARAIIGRPKILFFDEATNALDNVSQVTVTESINALKVTRIVIAHRLSTIRHADRILVLQNGKIVQQGGFDELLKQDGLFQKLMRRQQT
jgi:NHLM bacteriocin system ABC transporter ATP-binding protein